VFVVVGCVDDGRCCRLKCTNNKREEFRKKNAVDNHINGCRHTKCLHDATVEIPMFVVIVVLLLVHKKKYPVGTVCYRFYY